MMSTEQPSASVIQRDQQSRYGTGSAGQRSKPCRVRGQRLISSYSYDVAGKQTITRPTDAPQLDGAGQAFHEADPLIDANLAQSSQSTVCRLRHTVSQMRS